MVNSVYFEEKKSQLYKVLKYCFENVPYYKDNWNIEMVSESKFDYDFFSSHIPVLEKNNLKVNTDLFIADTFKKEYLKCDVTSGTEGKPMVCYKSEEERVRCSNALWMKRRSWVRDLTPRDRFARFYAFRSTEDKKLITNSVLYKDNDIHIPLFDMSGDKLSEYWNNIIEFKPRWMHGPSTAIFNIAKHVKEYGLPKCEIEFVELNGEFVPQEHIDLIREVFGSKVANHYGSREFWAIGFSCHQDKIHILDKSVYVENVYNEECKANEILVTTLTNMAWPLVRYRIGDVADVYINEDCSCTTKGKYCLDLKRGRRADYFKLKNGQTINAIIFSGVARGLSNIEGRSVIYQYQVIKHTNSFLEIKLCMNESTSKRIEDIISKYNEELRKIISNDIQIKYEIVDYILPDSKTGKCKDFIDLSK